MVKMTWSIAFYEAKASSEASLSRLKLEAELAYREAEAPSGASILQG